MEASTDGTGPGVIVRPSRMEDMAAVADIYRDEVLYRFASFEEQPPSAAELARRREAVLQQGLPYLVAEVDGRIAGYAYAGPYRPRPAYRYTVENSVYVTPAVHRRGVGRALLGALIAQCEAGPWRQMIAVIGDTGNTASIGLHASLGFRQVGVLNAVGFKLGRWVDSVIMQRPLGRGDATLPDADGV